MRKIRPKGIEHTFLGVLLHFLHLVPAHPICTFEVTSFVTHNKEIHTTMITNFLILKPTHSFISSSQFYVYNMNSIFQFYRRFNILMLVLYGVLLFSF